MKKLTKAQQRELSDMATRDYRSHYADEYKPIKALLALGYVDRQQGGYGSTTFAITPAGRAALTSTQEGNDEA